MKVIKSVNTKRYHLLLLQDANGRYHIRYDDKKKDEVKFAVYTDFALANYFFDIKLQELEGH